jgi:hypothetical protein
MPPNDEGDFSYPMIAKPSLWMHLIFSQSSYLPLRRVLFRSLAMMTGRHLQDHRRCGEHDCRDWDGPGNHDARGHLKGADQPLG